VGACVVTYGVGGLSAINACAGCYSEDLPVIFISGGGFAMYYVMRCNHMQRRWMLLSSSALRVALVLLLAIGICW
jgi:thiamine pyrophosphate-dependent acetolactate synthase large subunit-like protein